MAADRSRIVAMVVGAVIAACGLGAAQAVGADDPLEFLHALHQRGYGELAIEYLGGLKAAGKLDGPLEEAFDAEMAASLRLAARETRDDAEVLRRLTAAGEHVRNSLRRDPRGLIAARLVAVAGQIEMDKAAMLAATEPAEGGNAKAEASLVAARASFSRAIAICVELLRAPPTETAKPPARPVRGKPRAEASTAQDEARKAAESLLIESRLNLASVDLKLGLACTDRNDPQREKRLRSAAKEFDEVFQEHRGDRVGVVAHFWHAKTLEAIGDRQTAIDVLDEVLSYIPAEGQPRDDDALEELFAEAERLRLGLLTAQDEIEKVAEEADSWLKANPPARKTAAYGGIRLEQAKAVILIAARKKNEKLMPTAIEALSEAAKSPGPHQREAILLQDRYARGTDNATLSKMEDAAAMGDAAANAGVWEKAIASYKRAIELSKPGDDRDKVLAIRLRLARSYAAGGQPEAAAKLAEEIVRGNPQHPQAQAAAALAVRALATELGRAEGRAAAETRLADLIGLMAKQWPDRADADQARLVMAEAAIARGDLVQAQKTAELVGRASSCRRQALFLIAQIHWQAYLAEKKKSGKQRDEAVMESHRRAAAEVLAECSRSTEGEDAAARDLAQKALLLSGEFQLEAGEPAKALDTIQPLTDAIAGQVTVSPQIVSRVFRQQIVAALMQHDATRAAEAALQLAEIGDDAPATNSLLCEALRALGDSLKSRSEPEAGAPADESVARQQRLLKELVGRLTTRKNHSLAGLASLAAASASLGDADRAGACYDEILKRAESEEDASPAAKAAVARARGRLVADLRGEKRFEDALAEADRLVKENPNLVEALMEKGRVLQGWAETKPAVYDDALAVWTRLRLAMARMPKKPPEYYEAVYSAAVCLVQKSGRSGDAAELAEARQLLKSALLLSPELDSPERVAKYKALLEKCRFREKNRLSD